MGGGFKKVRFKISSKGIGKSGGARVVYQDVIIDKTNKKITFVSIWDKSEMENININKLRKLI